MAVIVRAGGPHDVEAIAGILEASDESAAWPGAPGWPYVEHLVARARVNVAIVDDAVVGMAGSIEVGRRDVRFLTDLFVHPDRQDLGAGRALLAAELDGATERMTFSSADPRALGAYIRAGMRPWWPALYVTMRADALGAADSAIRVVEADVRRTAEAARTWNGHERQVDFTYYASLPDAAGHLVVLDGVDAGVVWARRSQRRPGHRAVDHVSIAPGADAAAVATAALRAALGEADGLVAVIPGPHPVLPRLLDRGARIVDRDQFCATDPALVDPTRILPNPAFL